MHNTFEHKQAVEGIGGRGSFFLGNINKDIYLHSIHKQGNCIPESLRHRDLDSPD